MDGYAAAVESLANPNLGWPGIKEDHTAIERPLDLARFLPSRIHRAFAFADPSMLNAANLGEMDANLPETDKPAFDNAKENAVNAARTLVDAAAVDPDGIVGIYLMGLPRRKYSDGPWVSFWTPIEKLMKERPELFRVAAACEDSIGALWKAGESDPRRRNMRQMMRIGRGIISYSHDHENKYPETLDVLFQQQVLKAPVEPRSLLTGSPYVYLASGERRPVKGVDWCSTILLYDDNLINGRYQCLMADGSGCEVRGEDLQRQLVGRHN
jgi:hypothetical protein